MTGAAYERPRVSAAWRTPSGIRLEAALMLIAFIAGLGATLEFARIYSGQHIEQMITHEEASKMGPKTPLYYMLHGLEIAGVLGAGAVAAARLPPRSLSPRFWLCFWLLQAAGVLMTVRGLTLSEMLSQKIVASTGPLLSLLSVGMFVGVDERNWKPIVPLVPFLTGIASTGIWVGYYVVRPIDRSDFFGFSSCTWCALFGGLWCLFRARAGLLERAVGWYGLGTVALMALFSRTRLPMVLAALAVCALAIVHIARREVSMSRLTAIAAAVCSLALVTSAFDLGKGARIALNDAGTAFAERLDEDTRTEQIVAFFDDVKPPELILGRGAMATWNWAGIDWAGATDVGYLTLVLFGGLPLLAGYLGVHVLPMLGRFRRGLSQPDLHYAIPPAIWAVLMFSSAAPACDTGYYLVLLCCGWCAAGT